MRLRWILVCTALLAGTLVAVSRADHGENRFSGSWSTNLGRVDFRVVGAADGATSIQALGGSTCPAPTVYYHGDYSGRGGVGTMAACTKGASHLVGRYVASPSNPTQGGGDINITLQSSTAFSGFYTGDDFPGMTFDYNGTFTAHLDGDGCCPATTTATTPATTTAPATTTTTTVTTPTCRSLRGCGTATVPATTTAGAPPVTPQALASPATPPALGSTATYAAPAPGQVEAIRIPAPAKDARSFDGEVRFIDSDGKVVTEPAVWGVDSDTAGKAGRICAVLIFQDISLSNMPFGTCVNVVAQVLTRADEIKEKRAKARAAAKSACRSLTAGRRKAVLSITCTVTAGTVHLKIRAKDPKKRLAQVLTGRPRLIVARSRLAAGRPGDLMTQRWTASTKRG